jgi:precorrin-2 dehydrogenase/sirohydrochlorin ferrochelatase
MRYYPIFLELQGANVLVVGGGSVAQRKIETLVEVGANISIISNDLSHELKEMVDIGLIKSLGSDFKDVHMKGMFLVIAATDDKTLNHRISVKAREHGLLVNAVDQPADCNFIVPSILNRGDLIIAISTSGKSPAMAKKIRKMLEQQFGHEYGMFLILMGRLREGILSLGLTQEENSAIFKRVVDSNILNALVEDDWEEVESELKKTLPDELSVDQLLNRHT